MHSSSNNEPLLIQWQACALKLQLFYKLQVKCWFTYTLCCPYSCALVCNVLSSSPQQFNPIYSTATLGYASSFNLTYPAIHTLLHLTHNVSVRKNRLTKLQTRVENLPDVMCISFLFVQFIYPYIHLAATRLMTSTESALQQHTEGVAHLTLRPRITLTLQ
jgi:hypothetical protein